MLNSTVVAQIFQKSGETIAVLNIDTHTAKAIASQCEATLSQGLIKVADTIASCGETMVVKIAAESVGATESYVDKGTLAECLIDLACPNSLGSLVIGLLELAGGITLSGSLIICSGALIAAFCYRDSIKSGIQRCLFGASSEQCAITASKNNAEKGYGSTSSIQDDIEKGESDHDNGSATEMHRRL